jgi:S-adenosylmethionine:tRNA ribosyltransferase-isomerase
LKLADFDYVLPPELIAQRPLATRSASRMLHLSAASALADRWVSQLPELLQPGDLLVCNDTRVVPARVLGRKTTGGAVEVFLERALPGQRALVQARASKGVQAGLRITTNGGEVEFVAQHEDMWEVVLPEPTLSFFERHGAVPLPPYIVRAADAADRERYQSVYARAPGAVAAPTASLHFDAALRGALQARGVKEALVTLHVGAGTFQPIRVSNLDAHRMHAEWFEVPASTVAAIHATRAAGCRVVAVGTTVARALESAAAAAAGAGPAAGAAIGELRAGSSETTLFIRPGYRFRVVDALLTNFHLPQSTLLMLVAALAGRERVLAAYEHAVYKRYRFFSYGDCMFVAPGRAGA